MGKRTVQDWVNGGQCMIIIFTLIDTSFNTITSIYVKTPTTGKTVGKIRAGKSTFECQNMFPI